MAEWKSRHQTEASDDKQAAFETAFAKNVGKTD
ncbi:hypothetical protein [Puniceibacterium confluentis]